MTGIAEELLGTPSEPAPTEPQPEVVNTPEPEVVETAPPETPETGVKPETPVEPPPTKSDVQVPLAALTGERDKRQHYQHQVAELQKQIDANKEAKAPPSVFEDEQGAFNALRSEMNETLTNQLLNAGQSMAVRAHDQDTVDKAVAWIADAVQTSPYLAQQFTNTPLIDQHEKAVELYKQELSRAEMENPEQLKAKLREEVLAELKAEELKSAQDKEALTKSIPTSLVGDASKGGLTGSDWSGPTPLESLIGSGG